jgi:tRNA (guanine37-N1)-methyltransferase
MVKIKELLKNKLTKKELELVPTSFDVVGSILIFSDFPKELIKKEKIIANTFLKQLKNIKTICKKTGKYSGTYRTPKLKIIAGEKTKETIHKENSINLKLNVEKVYFSTRSGNERLRISKLVKKKEEVLVMFSGCAPFPCVISKNSDAKSILGVEINPTAHKYAMENIILNKLTNIILTKGDVNKVLPKLKKKFDRILMPLPKSAEDFLELSLTKSKKGTIIHFYDFLNEKDFHLAKEKVAKACKKQKKKFKMIKLVKCGHFGPRVYRISLDFKVL